MPNTLDVAKGTISDLGVLLMWTTDPANTDLLGFDTFDETVTYLHSKMDSFNVTFEQGHQKRMFTVWETPWADAPGPKGELWTDYV